MLALTESKFIKHKCYSPAQEQCSAGPKDGAAQREQEKSYWWEMEEHTQRTKTTGPHQHPKAMVVQPELQINCNAVLVSTGGFSITFPKGLEGTSTIDIHPFQTVCSNIPLTTRTISNPITPAKRPFLERSSTANDAFPNDVVRRKQRSEAEAQVGIRQVFTTGKEGRWWQTIWTGSSTADLKGYKPENRMAKTPAIINTSLYIFSLPVVTNHSSFARVNCKDALSGKVCFLSGL